MSAPDDPREQIDAEQPSAVETEAEAVVEPLLTPVDGVPPVLSHATEFAEVAERLAAGTGPIAVDTERARVTDTHSGPTWCNYVAPDREAFCSIRSANPTRWPR